MPQQVVIGDVKRSLDLYREKQIPVLGVIQNMVSYQCECCGSQQTIFPGVEEQLAGVEQIGSLSLKPDLCKAGNEGIPYVLKNQSDEIYQEFERIAIQLEKRLETGLIFPQTVPEN